MTQEQTRTPGVAIASLVLGILGFLLGPLTAIPAVIFGHVARSHIKKTSQVRLSPVALQVGSTNTTRSEKTLNALFMGFCQIHGNSETKAEQAKSSVRGKPHR
jgi:hypothetical protein